MSEDERQYMKVPKEHMIQVYSNLMKKTKKMNQKIKKNTYTFTKEVNEY